MSASTSGCHARPVDFQEESPLAEPHSSTSAGELHAHRQSICSLGARIGIVRGFCPPCVRQKPQKFVFPIWATSALIPKFASPCGTLSCELRNHRSTSHYMLLVP